MREELAARGYDEGGCFVGEMKTKKKEEGLGIGKIGIANEDLKGSLRMHVLAPLVAARFEVVRGEVGSVVEALVRGARGQYGAGSSSASGFGAARKMDARGEAGVAKKKKKKGGAMVGKTWVQQGRQRAR